MTEIVKLGMANSSVNVLVDAPGDTSGEASYPILWPSYGEYPSCLDDFIYQLMVDDSVRNSSFRRALENLVPGKKVLDIGTGEHLVWALESLDCGADHVLAMEMMDEIFAIALARLKELNLEEKITLLKGSSTEIDTDIKADVCVAEIIGSIAGAEGASVIFGDARRRHLTPGGIIIPDRVVTHIAGVSLAEVMGGRPVAFAQDSISYLRAIFDWNNAPFDVRLRIRNPNATAIVSDSKVVETLEFNGDLKENQEANVELKINHPGYIDGALTWIELWCERNAVPINALDGKTNWASIYFPLFDSAIQVDVGDVLNLTFRTRVSDDGMHPDYELAATLHTAAAGEFYGRYISYHHGSGFRRHPAYRKLFPE